MIAETAAIEIHVYLIMMIMIMPGPALADVLVERALAKEERSHERVPIYISF